MPPATILVVDDDPVVVELLRVSFELEGHAVVTAAGGDAGLRQARALRPDVVVLDVVMPGRDGLEVARELRSDPATAGVPLLLLSARAQGSDLAAGLAAADVYVTKPFDPLGLVERALALIERSRVRQG